MQNAERQVSNKFGAAVNLTRVRFKLVLSHNPCAGTTHSRSLSKLCFCVSNSVTQNLTTFASWTSAPLVTKQQQNCNLSSFLSCLNTFISQFYTNKQNNGSDKISI